MSNIYPINNMLDVSTLNFGDANTWDLICSGSTDGIFQISSSIMRDACIKVQPRNMNDLIAILSLVRPDTMSELDKYVRRKNGQEEVSYIHEDLKPILSGTYGCLIYQEQIMKITKVFAGFSDGEADKFRKGIGKKDPVLVREQAEKFRGMALKNGYPEHVVNKLADTLKDMGSYSFNKSHATGYAITSYKTAYLKANHPIKFMCSLLSNQKKFNGSTDFEKVGSYIMKAMQMGIEIKNPNINLSQPEFSVVEEDILFGLNLIKGVGGNAVERIIELRPFNSFEDFLERTEKEGVVNKSVIISLIKSGSFDFTERSRSELLKQYGLYRFNNKLDSVKPIKSINKTHIQQLVDNGVISKNHTKDKEFCIEIFNEWRKKTYMGDWYKNEMEGDEYTWEYETISYHLKGNPFAKIQLPLWEEYQEGFDQAKIGGTIIAIKKTKVKRGRQTGMDMAFLTLDTIEGSREVIVFADQWEKHQDKLEKGSMVICRGVKQGEQLLLNGVKSLEKFIETEIEG